MAPAIPSFKKQNLLIKNGFILHGMFKQNGMGHIDTVVKTLTPVKLLIC